MFKKMRLFFFMLLTTGFVQAGVREASNGGGHMVAKLQGMMRQVTKERDSYKTENAKLKADLARLSKQHSQLQTDNANAGKKLAGQQGSNRKLKARQEQTYNKLVEVIDKFKVLKQQKNQLQKEFSGLKSDQEGTTQQLALCGEHNGKLIVSANELLERYQNKGTFSALLQSEGVLQFQSVEMEVIVQAYEDTIRAERYLDTARNN